MVSELEYGLETIAVKRTQQTTHTDDNKSGALRMTNTIDDKLKNNSSETGTHVL